MSRLLFVINPRSGVHSLAEFIDTAKAQVVGHELRFFVPQDADDFANVSDRARAAGVDVIVVVGGDGTTNSLLNELVKLQKPIYFFPAGTANDLAQELNHRCDFTMLCESLAVPEIKMIDILAANGKKFATVGGFGIGAVLTRKMNELRELSPAFKFLSQRIKSHSYPLLAAQVILQREYPDLHVEIAIESPISEGSAGGFQSYDPECGGISVRTQIHRLETACLLVANQSFLGGSLKVQNGSRNDDGFFDIFALAKQSRSQLLRSLFEMRQGKVPAGTFLARARSASIRTLDKKPICFFADGEPLEENDSFQFHLFQAALPVLVV